MVKLPNPETKPFYTSVDVLRMPELINIEYDLWELRITLKFPKKNEPVYVIFKTPVGFRVLDESDLTEFWSEDSRSNGWVWEIFQGGWIALENLRKEKYFSGSKKNNREFLISGIHDCVSIISQEPPKIYSA